MNIFFLFLTCTLYTIFWVKKYTLSKNNSLLMFSFLNYFFTDFYYLPLGTAKHTFVWPKCKNHWSQALGHHILERLKKKIYAVFGVFV